jgi:ATP-binding protein involved in chromosome partitioning
LDKNGILEIMKQIKYPGFSRDIVSFGLIQDASYENGKVNVKIAITSSDPTTPATIKKEVEALLAKQPEIKDIYVSIAVSKPKNQPQASGGSSAIEAVLPDVKYAIAIASGKGGVGKSTFTVNLACAIEQILREEKKRVGIMDCDIYGPSVPLQIGINERPQLEGEKLVPLENFGIKVMSMGFLIDEDSPVVWRGPMIMKTIQQFVSNVDWGKLEVLVIDLPPGTGDAQLSLVQTVPLSGAVIVTTPQLAAVSVAKRGAKMFGKVNVPLLGVAENMSYLEDEQGNRTHIFGKGGGQETAKSLETDFLGEVPLDSAIREGSDRGIPIVIAQPESTAAKAFINIAKQLLESLKES